MKKHLITAVLLSSLAGNAAQYLANNTTPAIALKSNNIVLQNTTTQCTAEQTNIFSSVVQNEVLNGLNEKFQKDIKFNDMRPLNRIELEIDLDVPTNRNGVPKAGSPKGKYCRIRKTVFARQKYLLADVEK